MLILEGFNEDIQIIAHVDPIQHLSVDSDADADLVKIHRLTWIKYSGIRTSLVTMHAVGQRRRNYDVTIARHQTLRSHAWRNQSSKTNIYSALLECYYNSVLHQY